MLLLITSFLSAATYEVTNSNQKIYSVELHVNGLKHSDSGTMYAYGYISGSNISIKSGTKSGKSFNNDTVVGIYKNKFTSSNLVKKSKNIKGKSNITLSFSPDEADYYETILKRN